jgi:hypothetical protein
MIYSGDYKRSELSHIAADWAPKGVGLTLSLLFLVTVGVDLLRA